MKECLKKASPYIITALVVCGILGVLSRSIPDCDSLNIIGFDDYGCGI